MTGAELRTAAFRYSADRRAVRRPSAEQYAATRRWLACARDALRWAREAPDGREAVWFAKACLALVRAQGHRDAARRWRGRDMMSRSPCVVCGQSPAEGESERCASCLGEDASGAVDAAVRNEARSRATIHAYYAAARHALALVRVYQREPGTTGRRERDALTQVARYRAAVASLRQSLRRDAEGARPGLSKASVQSADVATPERPGGARAAS